MATEASRIHAEMTNAMTEFLQFLKEHKEHPENLKYLGPLLPAFRITRRAIANFGKTLPKKDIEWCQKWQTLEPPELSADATTQERLSITDGTTQDNSLTTDGTNQDNSSTTDSTTQDNSSTTDSTTQDNSPTTDGTTQDNSSTMDGTAPDNSPRANNISATQDTVVTAKNQRTCSNLIDDEVLDKFKRKCKDFDSWTLNPKSFWKVSMIQENEVLNERSFFENTAKQPKKLESLKLIHRLDSVIAYLRYKAQMPMHKQIRIDDVEKFVVEKLGLPIEHAPKQHAILLSGRKRLKFCHLLSNSNIQFPKDCYDDVHFSDVNYGVLFLDIDDKIWNSNSTKNRVLLKKTIEDLEFQDIISTSEQSRAKDAAKALLQYRQASIENQTPPLPNGKENNSTTAQSDFEGSSSIVVSEESHPEDHLNNTRASKRSRTEDHVDNISSKRLRTEENLDGTRASEHVGTEENLDGTRASEHVGTEENLDGTRASERTDDTLEMLLQAAAFTGQNADTSETTIANLGLSMEQSDSEMMDSMMEELCYTAAFGLGFKNGQPNLFDDLDVDKVLSAHYGMHFSDDIQSPELENVG